MTVVLEAVALAELVNFLYDVSNEEIEEHKIEARRRWKK